MLEPQSGKVTALLRDRLLTPADRPQVTVTQGECLGSFSGEYDLFLVASITETVDSPAQALRCRVLLTPGGDGLGTTLKIPSKWVVSYGLSTRDSLTVSSLEPDLAVLALQRELVSLSGTVIEQQELPLPIPPGIGAQGVMALYGSLLILGVPPERLGM